MPRDHREQQYLHQHSSGHRSAVEESEVCGCFHCGAMFPPAEITEWVDSDEGGFAKGLTALCPRCGIDAVLPSAAGIAITQELLADMHRYWF